MIMGDSNANIGKENLFRDVAGRKTLHERTGGNGERLCN